MKIALLCPPAIGHVNPFLALADALRDLGHVPVFFQIADYSEKISEQGHLVRIYGEKAFPRGKWNAFSETFGALSGRAATDAFIAVMKERTTVAVQELPGILKAEGVGAIVADQVGLEASTVAEILGIPFVTLCNALPLDGDPSTPPFFTSWLPSKSRWARFRNGIAYAALERKVRPTLMVVNAARATHGLPILRRRSETYSKTLKLIRLHESLDFPRQGEAHVRWIGALVRTGGGDPNFPWELLSTIKPIVFVSMGSEVNKRLATFEQIEEALFSPHHQLVISLGRRNADASALRVKGDTLVFSFVPQFEMLRRASFFVTHGGLNSVLEALSLGVRMLVIPATNDQFGVAARIAHHNLGCAVGWNGANPAAIRSAFAHLERDAEVIGKNLRRYAEAASPPVAAAKAARLIERAIAPGNATMLA
jgi:zeaxanthin glucosyltransferase